ncbi:cysteine synthase [Ceratobasidium sp. AG-Ba]|nr:cysteine synthase [Ceratobasidium sp. AG-Ba]
MSQNTTTNNPAVTLQDILLASGLLRYTTPVEFYALNNFIRFRFRVHRTPVSTSSTADKLASESIGTSCQIQLLFKCENLQRVGGNHAQGLAYAAKAVGARCCIVMPSNATPAKIAAVRGYGAIVTLCEPITAAREETARRVVEEERKAYPERRVEVIPSYDDVRIIAGQGTLAVEFLEQADEIGRPLDVIVAPIGGGGMLSGCSVAVKGLRPGVRVVGAEPAGAGDASQSFKTKKWVPSIDPKTFCDGLLTSTGKITFPLILNHVDAICTVTEEEIACAMKFIWERMKLVIEPSSAVPLAVVLYSTEFRRLAQDWVSEKQSGLNIGLVISGGNVNMKAALEIINSVPEV